MILEVRVRQTVAVKDEFQPLHCVDKHLMQMIAVVSDTVHRRQVTRKHLHLHTATPLLQLVIIRSCHHSLYSHQTFTPTICWSVCLSTALWQNGWLDMDMVWDCRSNGSRMRQVVRFGDQSTGGGNLGKMWGRNILIKGEFAALLCESAWTVRAAVWGGAMSGSANGWRCGLFPNYFGQNG